ncbi:longitudinals lacking protein, isoforms N/O/W/X/Y-like [Myzus persicae]|uniref:longitudinals lacking protein, isoforms N/O/W/X/Y-like n=1 Tax=Myzus persicae TaxID=13164 RepID=UPI000B937CFA|nr:longitudinals lacking protein, isoforms N/O/W/X/Y-like [Myzus persicae]
MIHHLRFECGVDPQFKCPYCTKRTNRLSTTGPEARFVCPRNCGRTYKWKAHLTTHLKNECGVYPKFKCPYCSKLSHQKSNLKRHILCVHNVLYNDALIDYIEDIFVQTSVVIVIREKIT